MTAPAVLAPLTVPGLRRLLAAQVPADLADWLDYVALFTLLSFHWQRGPGALAGLTLALALPYVVLGPAIGVLVDRADLKRLMIGSNLGRAAATAGFALAPDLATLLALVLLKSTVDAAFTPAKQAALPLLTPPERLMAANGLSHTITQISKIGGPAAGGLLVALTGPQAVFLANAVLSLAAALLLAGLAPLHRPPAESAAQPGFRGELAAGFAHLRRRPVLTTAIVAMSLGFFVIFLYDALAALLLRQMGMGEAVFGLAVAAAGGGGVAGALALGQFAARRDPLRLMAAGGVASGLMTAAMGHAGRGDLDLSAAGMLALMAAAGFTSAALFVPYRTVLQREAAPAMLGRVTAVGEAAGNAAMLAAPPLGAWIAAAAGVPVPYLLGGYLMVALGLLLALVRGRVPASVAARGAGD